MDGAPLGFYSQHKKGVRGWLARWWVRRRTRQIVKARDGR